MSSYQAVKSVEEGAAEAAVQPTVYRLQVEWWRWIAYLSFWGMCMFAGIMFLLTVSPFMGPCPLTPGAEPTYGAHCSDLKAMFGFNNICVTWDYSPSREATALVYPLFEYSLIAYVIFDFLQRKNDYDNGLLCEKTYKVSSVLLKIKIVLIAWFRMIFVCAVDQGPIPLRPFGGELDAVTAHTLGFFGMQFALVLIAFENVGYMIITEKDMWGMSVETTKKAAIAYLVTLFVVTCLKVSWASSIFIFGSPWIDAPWPNIFDRFWMVLAAVMPLFFAQWGMRNEPDMVITIVNEKKE